MLHRIVLDLPQLYTKPLAIEILKALDHLAIQPKSFGFGVRDVARRKIDPTGVTEYLTTIISSSLKWVESDDLREQIWDVAAARLSERAGRTAMPAFTRLFNIPTSSGEEFTLNLHEPSLTSDNLGMKTWVSSYLLSRRLDYIFEAIPELVRSESTSSTSTRLKALELGSGTGLVGLSFAALRGASASIHLTDLPVIVPNLARNVELNSELLNKANAKVTTGLLDWSIHPASAPTKDELYDVILAADPLYSPDHPKWLVQTINTWLSKGLDARVVVELPLRDAYLPQVDEFRRRMEDIGLAIVEQGDETGYDDWEDADGQSMEVHCWWSVWGWSEKI
ncbi:Protein-lysine N-methyltransferase rrg1 [Talaromyces marneffei ATCC 18224]